MLWQVVNRAENKMLYRFYSFMLLKPYAFKTLCFYGKLPVCKRGFFSCLIAIFTACPTTVRQIKRIIYLLYDVWQCLAFNGCVCPGIALQYS
jgi:hypothetical protein